MSHSRLLLLCSLCAAALAAAPLSADVIHLSDGRQIECRVTRATGNTVIAEIGEAQAERFRAIDVVSIEFVSSDESARECAALVDAWQRSVRLQGEMPSASAIADQLGKLKLVATIGELDRMLAESSAGLALEMPLDPEFEFGRVDVALFEALEMSGWWRTEALACDLLAASVPSEMRVAAASYLATNGTTASLSSLGAALESNDFDLALVPQAIANQVKKGHLDAVLAVIGDKLSSKDPQVRVRAWASLQGAIFTDDTGLLEAGLNDSESSVRREVVATLASVKDARTIEYLDRVVTRDDDPAVVFMAVRAIGNSGFVGSFPFLLELAEGAEEDWMRKCAADAMAALTGASYGDKWDRWQAWWLQVGAQLAETEAEAPMISEVLNIIDQGTDPSARAEALAQLEDNRSAISDDDVFEIARNEENPLPLRMTAIDVLSNRRALPLALDLCEIMSVTQQSEIKQSIQQALIAFTGSDLGVSDSTWVPYLDLLALGEDRVSLEADAGSLLGDSSVHPLLHSAVIRLAGERKLVGLTASLTRIAAARGLSPTLRRDALLALGEMPLTEDADSRASINTMIDLLEGEDAILATSALASLRRLSGQDLGTSASSWMSWLSSID